MSVTPSRAPRTPDAARQWERGAGRSDAGPGQEYDRMHMEGVAMAMRYVAGRTEPEPAEPLAMTRDEYRRRMGALETALETGTMRPMAVYEAAGSLGSEYRRGLYGAVVVRPVALVRPEPALRREVEPLSWWRRAMRWLGW